MLRAESRQHLADRHSLWRVRRRSDRCAPTAHAGGQRDDASLLCLRAEFMVRVANSTAARRRLLQSARHGAPRDRGRVARCRGSGSPPTDRGGKTARSSARLCQRSARVVDSCSLLERRVAVGLTTARKSDGPKTERRERLRGESPSPSTIERPSVVRPVTRAVTASPSPAGANRVRYLRGSMDWREGSSRPGLRGSRCCCRRDRLQAAPRSRRPVIVPATRSTRDAADRECRASPRRSGRAWFLDFAARATRSIQEPRWPPRTGLPAAPAIVRVRARAAPPPRQPR